MAKRERYSATIKCKKCGQTGTGEFEENENPVHGRGFDTVIKSVSSGFKLQLVNGKEAIYCEVCDEIIP